MPPKGDEFEKIKRIVKVLLANPEGIWLRRLSKEAKLPLSTVHYYLEFKIPNLVDNIGARNEKGHFFGIRLIRLKKGVISQLSSGNFEKNLKKLLTTSKILSNLE